MGFLPAPLPFIPALVRISGQGYLFLEHKQIII